MNKELKPLSKSKARMLYRGKAKSLQGLRVELADWPSGSRIREQFYWSLLKRNSQQMNAYWASLTFSGKARQPVEFQQEDIQQLVAWLKKHPNRLAYARVNDIPSGANIIYVVKENE